MLLEDGREYFPEDMVELREIHPTTKFEPKEVIWCKYRFKTILANNKTELVIEKSIYKYELSSQEVNNNIEKFAKSIASGRIPNENNKWEYDIDTRDKPSDFGVKNQCFVLIELSIEQNWQFRTSGSGITTRDKHRDSNFSTRHIVSGGVVGHGQYPNGCRVLYFSMVARDKDYERQKFNFHVEMISKDDNGNVYAIGVVIDPDIRNTGGMPIPPPGP